MNDILQRLRLLVPSDSSGAAIEAADTIAALTARVEELEGALDDVVQWADHHGKDPDWLEAARAAITQETRDER